MTHAGEMGAWAAIVVVAGLAVVGEVLMSAGMVRLGDLDDIRRVGGLTAAIRAVLGSPRFVVGALCMALNFFAMLYALSNSQLSLAGPAIGALTYIGNAIAGKLYLRESVDQRRWFATLCVAMGVILLR